MDARQILNELARVQYQVALIKKNLDHPVDIVQNFPKAQPGTQIGCPKCFAEYGFNMIRLQMPSFNFDGMERASKPGGNLINVVRVFEIMDAYCERCKFDWQHVLQRIDPGSASAELVGIKPELRFNNLCESENCLELGVRGFFRKGHCTGGICTTCARIIAPVAIAEQYVERVNRLNTALNELKEYGEALQKMHETHQPSVIAAWEEMDPEEDDD